MRMGTFRPAKLSWRSRMRQLSLRRGGRGQWISPRTERNAAGVELGAGSCASGHRPGAAPGSGRRGSERPARVLLIQIAAQQHEFEQLYAPAVTVRAEEMEEGEGAGRKPRRRRRKHKLETRRRAMVVSALIVDKHLQLLQKRDVKDVAKSGPGHSRRCACRRWISFARSIPGRGGATTGSRHG